jgi:septal ring factor EnvC (AmiA/AmiB activator)
MPLIKNFSFMKNCITGFICLLFIVPSFLSAQSKKELEKKKAALHKEIEYTNKLLNQTKKNKSTSVNQLVTLNKKLNARNELIKTMNSEIGNIDTQIGAVSLNIDSLEKKMEQLKKQYTQMLYYAYKSQSSYSRLSFIFSANDFNQAYKRFRYLQHLSDYRIQQKQLIEQLQDSLNGTRNILQETRTEKSQLLNIQKKEKNKLDQEKKEQVAIIKDLSAREKKLRSELKQKQKDEEKLSKAIEDIIRKEIAEAQKKAQIKEKGTSAGATKSTSTTSSSVLALTPEAQRLSSDFAGNKGRLPWPVEQGFISSTFGRHAHPVWKDVVVNNNGIDINTSNTSKARAIFNGNVLRVLMVVDKYAVLLQHGEYFTLYSNLREVFVKAGDKVTTKQSLGVIQTDDSDGKTEVHLEVWKGSSKMDPQNWIMPKN